MWSPFTEWSSLSIFNVNGFNFMCCNDFYRPQTKFVKVIFLQLSVIVFTGGGSQDQQPLGADTPGAETPPESRHPPGAKTPLQSKSPGNRRPPPNRHPSPGSRHPPGVDTHPLRSACWEIRAIGGRYASYWNAFLFLMLQLHSLIFCGFYL